MDFDYGIIGGGPAGYTLAMMLAQNASVVLFEKDKIGGTCLNKGCIPTKSMLHSSELYKEALNMNSIGLDFEVKNFDFSKVIEKRDNTIERIRRSLEVAVKNSNVNIIYQKASIKDKNIIITPDNEYNVSKIIIATGSKPRELKGLEFDGKFILNSDDILKLTTLPKTVLIVGSGAIGIEWARIFSNFGVDVHIVELAEHLIPIADIEVSKRIERIFKQNKIKYYLQDCIQNIDNKTVTLKSGLTLNPDFILVAVGRVPTESPTPDITVIGDASNEIQLAHYAIQQAKKIALNVQCDKNFVPSVIYGEPEIAWVGTREQDCGEDYKKITLPISALGKSWCDEATDGFIKIIEKNNQIIGAHIVSKEASALIHQVLIAMQNNINIDKLKEICFAHPTYSEGIFENIMKL